MLLAKTTDVLQKGTAYFGTAFPDRLGSVILIAKRNYEEAIERSPRLKLNYKRLHLFPMPTDDAVFRKGQKKGPSG